MPVITTAKFLPDASANPKPARGINWVGNPIPDGEDYFGNKIVDEAVQEAPQKPVEARPTRRKRKVRGWTPEKRKALSERLKALWHDKHATDMQSSALTPDSPSVSTDVT